MKKKLVVKIVFCIAIAYIAESIIISVQIGRIVKSSYINMGKNNPYTYMISNKDYERMSYRSAHMSVAGQVNGLTESKRRRQKILCKSE